MQFLKYLINENNRPRKIDSSNAQVINNHRHQTIPANFIKLYFFIFNIYNLFNVSYFKKLLTLKT